MAAAAGAAGSRAGAVTCKSAPLLEPARHVDAAHLQPRGGGQWHRTVYLAGQTGGDGSGKIAEGFHAQAIKVMENIKTALASVGGGFEHVVKLNSYLINIEANGAEFREVRGSYYQNKSALPASTLVQVPRLANPAYLLEIEAIAILPPKAQAATTTAITTIKPGVVRAKRRTPAAEACASSVRGELVAITTRPPASSPCLGEQGHDRSSRSPVRALWMQLM